MLEALSGQNAVLLMIAVAGFWFTARFVVGPKRGAPGLRAMFSREAALPAIGLGREAIASLIADTRSFVRQEPALTGVMLAGPFAAKTAEAGSPVIFIAFTDRPALYSGQEWLGRWPYIARGHDVIGHETDTTPIGILHRFTLKGAPPVAFFFETMPALHPPEEIREAMEAGSLTLEDPTGQLEKLRRAWVDQRPRNSELG